MSTSKNTAPSGAVFSVFLQAGVLGFEPRLTVLETAVLPLTPHPSMDHAPILADGGTFVNVEGDAYLVSR